MTLKLLYDFRNDTINDQISHLLCNRHLLELYTTVLLFYTFKDMDFTLISEEISHDTFRDITVICIAYLTVPSDINDISCTFRYH